MVAFQSFISERFVNVIGTNDFDLKNKYAQQVWNILQTSYASIGGIKGSGFNSIDDMIKNIPMWKMVVKNGVVHAVVMYKDRGGRKSVAVGSNGSDYAKKHLADLMKVEITRSYGEKSKASLGAVMKLIPWDILKNYIKTPTEASKVIEKTTIAIEDVERNEWPSDAVTTLTRYPELLKFGYMRTISGKLTFKVMIGSAGNRIS